VLLGMSQHMAEHVEDASSRPSSHVTQQDGGELVVLGGLLLQAQNLLFQI